MDSFFRNQKRLPLEQLYEKPGVSEEHLYSLGAPQNETGPILVKKIVHNYKWKSENKENSEVIIVFWAID